MTFYSMFADKKNYAFIGFDRDEIRVRFGKNPKNQIDLSSKPRSYKENWQPITVDVSPEPDSVSGPNTPDIMPFAGKMYLSQRAYDTLHTLIQNDGEFLPVKHRDGTGFIFNVLRVAEDVDGLDTKLSVKDELGEIRNMAFHEGRISELAIFKTAFENHRNLICREDVKQAIEAANLGGVVFTTDLGNQFFKNSAKQ